MRHGSILIDGTLQGQRDSNAPLSHRNTLVDVLVTAVFPTPISSRYTIILIQKKNALSLTMHSGYRVHAYYEVGQATRRNASCVKCSMWTSANTNVITSVVPSTSRSRPCASINVVTAGVILHSCDSICDPSDKITHTFPTCRHDPLVASTALRRHTRIPRFLSGPPGRPWLASNCDDLHRKYIVDETGRRLPDFLSVLIRRPIRGQVDPCRIDRTPTLTVSWQKIRSISDTDRVCSA